MTQRPAPSGAPLPARRRRRLAALAGAVILAHAGLLDAVGRVAVAAPVAGPAPVQVRLAEDAAPAARPVETMARTAPAAAPAAVMPPARRRTAHVPPDGPGPAPARPEARPEPPADPSDEARSVPPPDTAAPERPEEPAPVRLALATGLTPDRPAAGPAAPVRTPPATRLRYRVTKGVLAGSGTLDWATPSGTAYRMRLEARVPMLGAILVETSEGRLDAQGVAPLRHTERRMRRSERAVNFVRDDGRPRILFSAREGEAPLRPGAQDRLSWIAQLAARLAGLPARPAAGLRIDMDVASTGGDVQHWVFTVLQADAQGPWHLRREPEEPDDTRAEVWTDPARHHWPARVRLSDRAGDPLELAIEP